MTYITNISTGPTSLNLLVTMNAVYNYLNETWETKGQQHVIGSLGQVVLILAPLTQISEIEQHTILKLLQEIRYHHPGKKTNNAYSFLFLYIYLQTFPIFY